MERNVFLDRTLCTLTLGITFFTVHPVRTEEFSCKTWSGSQKFKLKHREISSSCERDHDQCANLTSAKFFVLLCKPRSVFSPGSEVIATAPLILVVTWLSRNLFFSLMTIASRDTTAFEWGGWLREISLLTKYSFALYFLGDLLKRTDIRTYALPRSNKALV